MTPRWRATSIELLERERDVDAVVVFTVPMSHLRGIPTLLRERFGVPVVFYDGDVPMSLPEFGGMDTGFNYYYGADPSEYDLVVSNSEGGLDRLRELGARRAEAVFWAADPELFRPLDVEKETDVFFYGYGDKFRQEWTRAMVGEPSRRLDVDFALGGRDFRGDTGRARHRRRRPVQRLLARDLRGADQPERHAARRTRTVYASSTCRPFELAMSGAAIVSNPHDGIERWFEPGRELLVVTTPTRRPAPTGSCSPTRAAPRRWAAPPASARSTSTPTSTAPAGCSTCSASAARLDGAAQERRCRLGRRRSGELPEAVRG